MSGSNGSYGAGNYPAQNGIGLNQATGNYELGGDLTRPTVINISSINTLALSGLVAGDPTTDSIIVITTSGVIRFVNSSGLPDFWRSGTGGSFPDGTNDTAETIVRNGGVGVGLADPTRIKGKFHVSGPNANGGGTPLVKVTDTNLANSYFAIDNGQAANAYRAIATTNFELQSGSNSNQLFLGTNGGIGFGTNAPTAGNGNVSAAGNGFKPGGGARGAFSDLRVKRNIAPIKWGLKELLLLNPVSFQYNGAAGTIDDGKTYYSLIAQEVEPVLPEFIEACPIADDAYDAMSNDERSEFPDRSVLMLKEGMTNLEAILIQAVKELSDRVKFLEERLSIVGESA